MNKILARAKALVAVVMSFAALLGIDGDTQLDEIGKKIVAAVIVALGVYVVPNKQD